MLVTKKIGRNEKCSCGSGLKYKRCHGRESAETTKPGRNVTSGPTIHFEPLGFPGQNGNIVSEPLFPSGDPRNDGIPSGSPGKYQVIFTLSRLGQSLSPERSILPAEALKGDSHLRIGENFQINANCEGEEFRCIGIRNERGFLAALNIECQANNL